MSYSFYHDHPYQFIDYFKTRKTPVSLVDLSTRSLGRISQLSGRPAARNILRTCTTLKEKCAQKHLRQLRLTKINRYQEEVDDLAVIKYSTVAFDIDQKSFERSATLGSRELTKALLQNIEDVLHDDVIIWKLYIEYVNLSERFFRELMKMKQFRSIRTARILVIRNCDEIIAHKGFRNFLNCFNLTNLAYSGVEARSKLFTDEGILRICKNVTITKLTETYPTSTHLKITNTIVDHWKKTLPHTINLYGVHTRITMGCLAELVELALLKQLECDWTFHFVLSNNQEKFFELQKIRGYKWNCWMRFYEAIRPIDNSQVKLQIDYVQ